MQSLSRIALISSVIFLFACNEPMPKVCGSKPDPTSLTKIESLVLSQSLRRNFKDCGKDGQNCNFGISRGDNKISVLINTNKYNQNTKQCDQSYGGWIEDYTKNGVFKRSNPGM